MNEFNVDFHIHGKFSGGTSPSMEIPRIAQFAELKGLDVVATSDCLHSGWLAHIKGTLSEVSEGLYKAENADTKFIIQTEIEGAGRVHHIILLPSIDAAVKLRKRFEPHSPNLDSDGRPNVNLSGEKIVEEVYSVGGIVGPAHAFTPYVAIYKAFHSIDECYGRQSENIHFVELGLSADTDYADRIEELQDKTFMTNSDCHSPQPHRLGREFNRLALKELSFPEIVKAIKREDGRHFTLNVGLNPAEGKYHLTACNRCFQRYQLKDAESLKMKCPECRGRIKLGVSDRIQSKLASWESPRHPEHRPPYIHILPLAEIISLSLGIRTITSKRIQEKWQQFIDEYKTEINVLLDAPPEDLKKTDGKIGSLIERFRRGTIPYVAGGGGQYGRPTLKGEKTNYWGKGQKKLGEF
ncbi:MAG: TIGR00375 family protein [Candidatus Altiarchaeota archaeon]